MTVSVTSPLTVPIKLVSTSFATFSLSLTPSRVRGETVVRVISTLARTVVLSSESMFDEETMATLAWVVLRLVTRLTGLLWVEESTVSGPDCSDG